MDIDNITGLLCDCDIALTDNCNVIVKASNEFMSTFAVYRLDAYGLPDSTKTIYSGESFKAAIEAGFPALENALQRMKWEFWFNEAANASDYLWCYSSLVDDHEPKFKTAFESWECPEETARWVGDKYDLDPYVADRSAEYLPTITLEQLAS